MHSSLLAVCWCFIGYNIRANNRDYFSSPLGPLFKRDYYPITAYSQRLLFFFMEKKGIEKATY